MDELKKYDRFLEIRKTLDWKKTLIRRSQYNTGIDYEILDLSNMVSWKWIIKKLKSMDSRNKDFFTSSIIKNDKIRRKNLDSRISEDVSKFVRRWEQIKL